MKTLLTSSRKFWLLWKSWSEEGEIPLGSFSMEEQAGNSILRINHHPTLNDDNHSMASNAIFFNFPPTHTRRKWWILTRTQYKKPICCMHTPSNNTEVPPNNIYPLNRWNSKTIIYIINIQTGKMNSRIHIHTHTQRYPYRFQIKLQISGNTVNLRCTIIFTPSQKDMMLAIIHQQPHQSY